MYRERNSMDDVLIRLENSYPFDSNWDGYDDEGYPVYDRAVAALMLRKCLRQFFTTGIFGTPESNLKLTKGDGFNINIHPGVAIIDGGIGAITDDAGMDITILDGAPRGIQTCSVFIRINDNEDARSLFVRVAHTVGDTPAEPITAPAIYELRLGYITVPSNAEDLSDAVLVDERGTSVCPYAAPFMEIDIADILANVREQAGEQYADFVQYLTQNMEFIASAIDGTTAGYLNNQIQAIKNAVMEDEEFVEYVTGDEDSPKSGFFTVAHNVKALHETDSASLLDRISYLEQQIDKATYPKLGRIEVTLPTTNAPQGASAVVTSSLTASVSGSFMELTGTSINILERGLYLISDWGGEIFDISGPSNKTYQFTFGFNVKNGFDNMSGSSLTVATTSEATVTNGVVTNNALSKTNIGFNIFGNPGTTSSYDYKSNIIEIFNPVDITFYATVFGNQYPGGSFSASAYIEFSQLMSF